jgi:hypothetical protein
VEHRVSGYLWIEPESSLRSVLYSLKDLDKRFDSLPNQPLAYRQSYLVVEYIAREYGEEALTQVITDIGRSIPFSSAVQRATGRKMEPLYAEWLDWVHRNLEELESSSGSPLRRQERVHEGSKFAGCEVREEGLGCG